MTTEQDKAFSLALIENEKTYDVRLARSVKRGAFTYRPLNEITMAGSMIKDIVDQEGEEAIDYANPL
ncbi:hypothetical protein GAO09_00260 [Rhizobiales bacterium RZME27]|uniref:Uncharacterized protein n=1 Tax=Endobacterium cereale TaxID=2663029 RepID=A0A6A8A404_9HYPH|nr:hypothetical protein [Endobacterium cereale]MQY44507.1 hypothetical protein [Endobacterium cereale]